MIKKETLLSEFVSQKINEHIFIEIDSFIFPVVNRFFFDKVLCLIIFLIIFSFVVVVIPPANFIHFIQLEGD